MVDTHPCLGKDDAGGPLVYNCKNTTCLFVHIERERDFVQVHVIQEAFCRAYFRRNPADTGPIY